MNPKPSPSPFATEWIVVLAISLASCRLSFGPPEARALALPFMASSVVLLIVLVAHERDAKSVYPKEMAKPFATVSKLGTRLRATQQNVWALAMPLLLEGFSEPLESLPLEYLSFVVP
jgi:hypothetical protein